MAYPIHKSSRNLKNILLVVVVWHIAYTVTVVKREEIKPLGEFSRAASAEIKGIMAAHGINQTRFAKAIERNQGYISERVNGIKAFNLDEIDALASLIGTTGQDILMRISRRVTENNATVREPISLDSRRQDDYARAADEWRDNETGEDQDTI